MVYSKLIKNKKYTFLKQKTTISISRNLELSRK